MHATSQPAPPAELNDLLPQARLIGQGTLRFFSMPVYEARLWAGAAFERADPTRHPLALELTYARKLSGQAIAERSVAEMRRIGPFSPAQAEQWQAMMQQAFPDVAPGDRLLGWSDGQGHVRFFHNGRPTAQVRDTDYSRLFFGIWLSPQTSSPGLRKDLLGLALTP